ncbi:MAG: hypothetical protein OXF79_10905 [Chloroflexi bacterium]|nr:hypothetical protein [Chloroflexota bacterium]
MTNLSHAPPGFRNAAGQQVMFVDFTSAQYKLEFDATAYEAPTRSRIRFKASTKGHAAISMNQPVKSAMLNGHEVELHDQYSPDKKASFKILSTPVSPGMHTLIIDSSLIKPGPKGCPVNWLARPTSLDCIFNMSDLNCDGGYLEAYLPSNYNFDQFQMSFDVTLKNSAEPHRVFSNGKVTTNKANHWKVRFPSFYTSSCPWFHLAPTARYEWEPSSYSSSFGPDIPILVYARSRRSVHYLLKSFIAETKGILRRLEKEYGPYPHETLTVLATGRDRGGMEYAGATSTGLMSLRHELDHSYFASSVIPCNGDAGWIDEAIATWADRKWKNSNYRPARNAPRDKANLGKRSPYVKTTHRASYSLGAAFMSHLDYRLQQHGGLQAFLAHYAKVKRHKTVSAVEFQTLLEKFSGDELQKLFDDHIYHKESGP